MDFGFTEEQQALRELARKILADRVTPDRLREIERSDEGIDRELWAELAKANLLGSCLPESVDGSGLGFFELCLLLQEAGRTVAPLPLWATLVLGALPLAEFGSAAQRERWLPAVVRGEAFLTAALFEPDSLDPTRPTTRAERVDGGWRLSGEKLCVPAAPVAARVLVPARFASGGVGMFLLDPHADGVALERQIATNHEVLGRLVLSRASVADADRLGGEQEGQAAIRWLADRAVVALCALQLGVVERALEITARYVAERRQFDRPIGSFQAVHQRAGDAYIDVELIRLTTWQAAWRLDQGMPSTGEIAVAKFFASEAGHRIVYAAQHLHGGIGVDVDYPIHRYYLWAREIELTLGSGARQLERLGEELARSPATAAIG